MLRANLATAGPAGGFPRTILMTSTSRGEGKTMSTLNLAITLAAAGASVIAVDADFRRPMLATVFGVASRGNGFADVFMNDAPLEHALVAVPGHGDRIRLVLGSVEDANLVDLLEPDRIRRGLERLAREADVLVIDSPALTEVADALTLAADRGGCPRRYAPRSHTADRTVGAPEDAGLPRYHTDGVHRHDSPAGSCRSLPLRAEEGTSGEREPGVRGGKGPGAQGRRQARTGLMSFSE